MSKDLTTKNEMSIAGTFMPSDFDSFVAGGGFASVETIMIGDPKKGKFPFYIGRIDGKGKDVEVGEENSNGKRNFMPTYVFHPMVKLADGKVGAAENITHVIPVPYQLDAACTRVLEKCKADNLACIIAVKFAGKSEIKGGTRMMNRFEIFEKYVPKAG